MFRFLVWPKGVYGNCALYSAGARVMKMMRIMAGVDYVGTPKASVGDDLLCPASLHLVAVALNGVLRLTGP